MRLRKKHNKFSMDLAEKIYFLAEKGFTDKEICFALDFSEESLYKWRKSPRFAAMLDRSKESVDDKVEQALLRRALGYKYTERRQIKKQVGLDANGDPVYRTDQEITEKEMPPSDVACMFWLKNRRREKWNEKLVELIYQHNQNFNALIIADRIKENYGNNTERITEKIAGVLGISIPFDTPQIEE